jgi:hypothetical protein
MVAAAIATPMSSRFRSPRGMAGSYLVLAARDLVLPCAFFPTAFTHYNRAAEIRACKMMQLRSSEWRQLDRVAAPDRDRCGTKTTERSEGGFVPTCSSIGREGSGTSKQFLDSWTTVRVRWCTEVGSALAWLRATCNATRAIARSGVPRCSSAGCSPRASTRSPRGDTTFDPFECSFWLVTSRSASSPSCWP